MRISAGVDIGGSHVSVKLYEHKDHFIPFGEAITNKVDNASPKDVILEEWAKAIEEAFAQISDRSRIKGVGFAVPGPFDYANGISLMEGDNKKYALLYKVNIRNELAGRLGFDPDNLRFINDACAFSVAEAKTGEAANFKKSMAITLGTGLGASFTDMAKPIVDGPLVPARGELYDQEFKGEMADDVFSTRGLINQYQVISGKMIDNAYKLAQLAKKNDVHALRTFNQFGSYLGEFLKPFIRNFGAEILVLGGNISKAFTYFSESLNQQLIGTRIYVSTYGEDAAMLGAVQLMNDEYYQSIADSLKKM